MSAALLDRLVNACGLAVLQHRRRSGRHCLLACLAMCATIVSAQEQQQFDTVYQSTTAPAGVVYEMVGGDADSLYQAILRTQDYTQRLKQKFPAMKFVILTHGLEQFALLRRNAQANAQLHARVQRLVRDENIPVQVCGAFAEMNGVSAAEFQDVVQVIDAAPVQIETYREQGYAIIEMQLNQGN